jgi:hypothetical protein
MNKLTIGRISKLALTIIGLIYALAPALLQLVASSISPEVLAKYIKDDFAIACIATPVVWTGFEFVIGLLFITALCLSLFYLKGVKQIITLYSSTVLFVFTFMMLVLPKIEKYSQGPVIEFISEFKDKPVWIAPIGYKSYATYFYSNKKQRATEKAEEEKFLLNEQTGQDVYFVTKVTATQALLEQFPQLSLVKTKGGFALLKRTGSIQ